MRAVLVASAGGHLRELHRLAARLDPPPTKALWVTSATFQTRDVLAGEIVQHVPLLGSRSAAGLPEQLVTARRLIARHKATAVLSTGAAIAVPYLLAARLLGVDAHYIECGARVHGPSLTGCIVERIPGVHVYNQHGSWRRRWRNRGSVYDGFRPGPRRQGRQVRRAVVALGSWKGLGFPRLVDRLRDLLPDDVEVLWQTGYTDVGELRGTVRSWLPATDLQAAMRAADVIVAHAGTGSALDAIEVGKCPVLVPRRRRWGEHVDDHQVQLAAELERRGLALCREVEDITVDVLREAAARSVLADGAQPPFALASRHWEPASQRDGSAGVASG